MDWSTNIENETISSIIFFSKKLVQDIHIKKDEQSRLRSSIGSLRRVVEHILKWLVYDAGLWDEVSRDENGRRISEPDMFTCVKALRQNKKITDDVENILDTVRRIGNAAVHDNDKIFYVDDVNELIEELEKYTKKFNAQFPHAVQMKENPNNYSFTVNKRRDILGCDIGNAFGFVSILKNAQYDPIPAFLPMYNMNRIGMPTTAYVAPPNGDKIEVFNGGSAKIKYHRYPERLVDAVKTKLRDNAIHIEGINRVITADEVYAAVARDLVKLANEFRVKNGDEPVYDLVFSFPAEFADNVKLLNRMKDSIEGIQLNGKHLHVVGNIPEPAAAAIDYLYCKQYNDDSIVHNNEYTALIYDLGHGTFDTAVVTARKYGDPYELHHFDGIEIGGKNFDTIIYEEFLKTLKRNYNYVPKSHRAKNRILEKAIEAKLALSNNTEVMVNIEDENGDFMDVSITRNTFESLSSALLEKTMTCIQSVYNFAADKGIKIDAVVLSGGASQMPMVNRRLKELFNSKNIPVIYHKPHLAVSHGTARYAYSLAKNATSHKIINKAVTRPCGIMLSSNHSLEGVVKIMLNNGMQLPATSKAESLVSSGGRMNLRVCRPKNVKVKSAIVPAGDCFEVIRIPFNVPANENFNVRMTMHEDYNISVTLTEQSGKKTTKSTNDKLIDLVR